MSDDARAPAVTITIDGRTLTFTADARAAFHAIATTRNGSVGYLMGRFAWSGPRVRRALRALEAAGAIERWRDQEISARAIYYRPVYAVPVPRPDPRR